MENPFPGMNPYLEDRTLWRSLQFRFVVHLCDAINAALPEGYWATFGKRVFDRRCIDSGICAIVGGTPLTARGGRKNCRI